MRSEEVDQRGKRHTTERSINKRGGERGVHEGNLIEKKEIRKPLSVLDVGEKKKQPLPGLKQTVQEPIDPELQSTCNVGGKVTEIAP